MLQRLPFLATIIILALSALIVGISWDPSLSAQLRWHILLNLQVPLLVNAILVGATLTTSAATLQVVLRNPLADPGIIGISSGAGLFAACLILFFPSQAWFHYLLPLGGFAGAMLSTVLIYRVARQLGGDSMAVLLAGIALSTLTGAVIAWLYLFADAHAMRNLTFWLMGNLYQADPLVLMVAAPVMLFSTGVQMLQAKKLNWLYGGDIAAVAAGTDVRALTLRSLIISALGVGACVAVAGSIAFIGLLVPHFIRLITGFDNRRVLPLSALSGAILLLVVVLITEITRSVTLPVSMMTATVGGPMLLYALYKGQWR